MNSRLSFDSFIWEILLFENCSQLLFWFSLRHFSFFNCRVIISTDLRVFLFSQIADISVIVTISLWILYFVLTLKFQHFIFNESVKAIWRAAFMIPLNVSILISIINNFCKWVFCTEVLVINLREDNDDLFSFLMNNFV